MQCVYKNCGNNSRTARRIKSLVFYPFPKLRTQKAKLELWMQNCGLDQTSDLGRTGYVCSQHFKGGAPNSQFPDPIPWDELSLDVAKKKKPSKKYTGKTIVIEDEVPKTLNVTASKELILELNCFEEELLSEQADYYKKEEKEYKEVLAKFEQLVKQHSGELVHKGDNIVAYQYNGTPNPPALAAINGTQDKFTAQGAPMTNVNSGGLVLQNKPGSAPNTYQLVMDPRLGLIVGTMTPTNTGPVTAASTAKGTTTTNVASVSPQVRATGTRKRGRPSTASMAANNLPTPPPPPPPVQTLPTPQPQPSTSSTAASNIRPAESTAVGGLSTGTTPITKTTTIVDLTSDDGKPAADSREVAFNKLQGKTFPSLVVVARPHLHSKEAAVANDRTILDTKVKQVLVYTPTKFTEWLIQQGLVRSEQQCALHPQLKLNLGMYSDVSKFPYSGGYVWISECCPHRFVSVFNGSLFESSNHPPSVLLKLIYHWACQTNIQNVVQWVKVDNLYVKGLFTWLRAACTLSLQKHLKLMGGPLKKIEVGVISLGTTSQDGSQRQVKVEVLGILDSEAKLIRLRAVEPLADGERNYKRRFSKILEPLKQWVHPESLVATDLTVDKGTLQLMGFQNVIQNTQTGQAGNQAVMEYLRKIVPRMFQNTLSLLSRQIIQQFLDELVWREWFGKTANQAFNSMTTHLAEQTRLNAHDTLVQRLNKVAANPFKNHWLAYSGVAAAKATPTVDTTTKRYNRKRPAQAQNITPTAVIDLEKPPPKKINITYHQLNDQEHVSTDSMVPLESYYYGSLEGDPSSPLAQKVILNVRCCVCKVPYTNNIQLLDHLLAHAHNISSKAALTQCRYCLASLASIEDLNRHIGEAHPVETKTYSNSHLACVICEVRFSSVYMLGKHMSKEHVPQEMPYQCGTCNYRTSSHRQVVDHFYREHNGATTVQCPFCLKSTTVWSSGRIMSTNVTFFLAHLQKHQKKAMAKKCQKCALWFIHKETLKDHQLKAHNTFVNKRHVNPFQLPSNYVMVPKSKLYMPSEPIQKPPTRPTTPEVVQHNVILVIPDGSICKECKKDITDGDHYPQKHHCGGCRYVTDCAYALSIHQIKCNRVPAMAMPRLKLDAELHCVCGYSSSDGNQVAKHLALCERKTAYPTAELAQAVTDTHSMLDVLGLVRRNDDSNQAEPGVSSPEDTRQETESTPQPTTDYQDTEDVSIVDEPVETADLTEDLEPKIEITDTEVQAIQ